MKPSIVVTGASGFLGGRLAELLAKQEPGARILLLARPASNLSHLARFTQGPQPPLTIVRCELTPDAALREALAGVHTLYHCAGTSTDWASAATFHAGNVVATQALLAAVPASAHFIHVSTTDVYGYPQQPGDECSRLRDTGLPYNRSKLLAERAVWQAAQERNLAVTVLRPASIYGPRGTAFVSDVVAQLRQRLMLLVDGGRAPGGFVYVDDVCAALLAAGSSPRARGQAYNLASTDGATWQRYCRLLAQSLGLRPPWLQLPFAAAMAIAAAGELPFRALPLPGRPLLTRHAVYLLGRNQQFLSAKAREHLGWSPSFSLEQGIARAAEWVRSLP